MGASGVGLFRTEYLYLTHPDVPDEEEQFDAYRDVIEASPEPQRDDPHARHRRRQDVPYLGHTHRGQPVHGLAEHPPVVRASRVLRHADSRAILRAAADAESKAARVRMMFPMITTLEEIRKVRGDGPHAPRSSCDDEGKPFAEMPMGMMLEVPAAAISIDDMLPQVDFVSIGSNDLVQYLMAADRDNPKVSHLCQPLAPPVLRVLRDVIKACQQGRTSR